MPTSLEHAADHQHAAVAYDFAIAPSVSLKAHGLRHMSQRRGANYWALGHIMSIVRCPDVATQAQCVSGVGEG